MTAHNESTSQTVQLTINGEKHVYEVDADETLMKTLRNNGYYEVKNGCSEGVCGACNVIVDGNRVLRSCVITTTSLDGSDIMTVDYLSDGDNLHPLQEEFLSHGAAQCGFCIPGMLLSAYNLLENNRDPSRAEIKKQINGNVCRCTGYDQQIEAIQSAAERLRESESKA